MNKIAVIISREFLTRIKKKSFILLTILMPFIIVALIFVPLWLSQIQADEVQHIAVVDETHLYAQALHNSDTFLFTPEEKISPALTSDSSHYNAVVRITENLSTHPNAVTIYGHKEISPLLKDYVQEQLNEKVRNDKLSACHITGIDSIISDLERTINVNTAKWDNSGNAQETSTSVAVGTGFLFTMLIYMFVLTYGMMVMQSVMEEKTNRIVEIMVSSVKPFQLLMGKIIGIALVGFLQLGIWCVMSTLLMALSASFFGIDTTAMASTDVTGMTASTMPLTENSTQILHAISQLPIAEILFMFVIMFIGGYLFYASFFAAIGASVNEQEDSNQFVTPFMLIMAFALYAAIYSAKNTDGPLAFWASLFPLTSPVVMMVRIPFGVPLWQEILSVVLLYCSAIFMVWVGAKIYRVGILIYGKKPTLKEMWKWIHYK